MIAIKGKSESRKFSKDRDQLHFDRDQGEIREEVRELEIFERSGSITIPDRDQGDVRGEIFFK